MAVAILVRRYEAPLISLLGQLTAIFCEHFQKAADKHLDSYPNLMTEVISKMNLEIEGNKMKAEAAIKLIINAEETFMNTEHPAFNRR